MTRLFSIVFLVVAFVRTGQAAESYLQHFDGSESAPLPAWMPGDPVAKPATYATVSFPILPPEAEEDLILTVFFEDPRGGFLRIYWDDGLNKEMLTDNLSESLGMSNRRTLIIKRRTFLAEGNLTFQSSAPVLGVTRIHWQWARPQTVYLDETQTSGGFVGRSGEWLRDDEVDGLPQTEAADYWQGNVVTALIAAQPTRIEEGVNFIAELPELPSFVRVQVKVNGLPLKNRLQLWVNDQLAGEVQVPVPNLSDPGYSQDWDGILSFTGWRDASLLVDVSLLKVGENQFYFQTELKTSALALKQFSVQLQYP